MDPPQALPQSQEGLTTPPAPARRALMANWLLVSMTAERLPRRAAALEKAISYKCCLLGQDGKGHQPPRSPQRAQLDELRRQEMNELPDSEETVDFNLFIKLNYLH